MSWFSSKSKSNNPSDPVIQQQQPKALSNNELQSKVDQFVSVSPQSVYLIDGAKGSNKSVICRKTENGGQTCLNLQIDGITLFKEMQGKQYFCSLPAEVEATHFECRKIQ